MAAVRFTSHLKRFFPELKEQEIEGQNVREVMEGLDLIYTGITDYLLKENGELRSHVNVFINGELIEDRDSLKAPLQPEDQLYIMQAISGG